MSPARGQPADPKVLKARMLRAAGAWQALVELAAPLPDEALYADPELAFLYAVGCRRTGDPARALEVLARIEPEARRRNDRILLTDALNLAGIALWESGETAAAEDRFAGLLEAAIAWNDEESVARACNNLGVLANVRGRRDQALLQYERALAAYQRTGNVRGLAETHHNLGISYRDLGYDREADAHFRRAMELAGGAPAEDVIAMAETERAMLRARAGDGALAQAMATRALERFTRLGEALGRADALRVLAAAARAGGRDDDAFPFLDDALEIARAHSDPLLMAEVQRDRGLLLRDAGDADAARQALTESAEHFARLGATADAEAIAAIVRGMDAG